MIVARRLLRDRRRSLMWWSLAIVAIVALVVGMFPSIQGKHALERMFDQLPAAIKAMAGTKKGVSIISPQGYLHGRLFAMFVPLLLTIFGIGLGAYAIGGAERDGTLELLLSNPVSRRRVVVERGAVLVVLLVVLGALVFASVVVATALVGRGMADISIAHIASATIGAMCVALLHASVAFSIGCITGRRTVAITVASTVAIVGYLLQVLTASVASLAWLGALSPWRWYLRRMMLMDGLNVTATLVPLVVSAVVVSVGLVAFERRDLR